MSDSCFKMILFGPKLLQVQSEVCFLRRRACKIMCVCCSCVQKMRGVLKRVILLCLATLMQGFNEVHMKSHNMRDKPVLFIQNDYRNLSFELWVRFSCSHMLKRVNSTNRTLISAVAHCSAHTGTKKPFDCNHRQSTWRFHTSVVGMCDMA